jgi:hypothetical protein
MDLGEYLAGNWDGEAAEGTIGKETRWLDFTHLDLKSDFLLVVDAAYVPSTSDGVLVELTPGVYTLKAKVMDYETDKRISRLRIVQQEQSHVEFSLQASVEMIRTEMACLGVCDYEVFSQEMERDPHAAEDRICEMYEQGQTHGVVQLDETRSIVMPFVSSGFGDGEYPVYTLIQDESLVGVEVEFIPVGEPYPF